MNSVVVPRLSRASLAAALNGQPEVMRAVEALLDWAAVGSVTAIAELGNKTDEAAFRAQQAGETASAALGLVETIDAEPPLAALRAEIEYLARKVEALEMRG